LKKPPSFDRAWAPLLFESPLKTLIHQFKYNGDLRSENFLKNMLAENFSKSLQSDPFNIDVIVPVPLHYQRLLQRSFNQSYQLACTIGASINRPIDQSLVKRIRKTDRQEGLNAKQRQQNLHQAFQVSASVKGKDILLIDDVMTTGATAESISIQLKQQGAHSVSILCIARTPIHSS
jgi:ComF family protein